MEPGNGPVPRRRATLVCAVTVLGAGFLLGGTAANDLIPGPGLPAAADTLVARADAWRPWTWITATLVPRALPDLCLGVFFLLAFGTLIETAFGPRTMLTLLGGGAVATTLLARFWLDGAGPVPIHGTAGGVHALAGAAFVLLPRMGLRVTPPFAFQAGVRPLVLLWALLALALENRTGSAFVVPFAQALGLPLGALAGTAIRRRTPPATDTPPPWRAAEGLRASDEWIRARPRTHLIDDWFWMVASLACWSFAAVLLTLAIAGWDDAQARGTAVTRLLLGLLCVGFAVASLLRWRRD
jgi:membrane associated rhomboid family serine protease